MDAHRPSRIRGVVLALAALAGGCQTAPHPPAALEPAAGPITFPADQYHRLAQRGPVYVVDADASRVAIYVYRTGPLARLGHNHVVMATRMRGAIYLPDDPGDGRFDLVLPVEGLALDRPEWRRETAGAFDGTLSADAIEGTRKNMLGADVLDGDRYPRIAIRATSVAGGLPVLTVKADIVLHGVRNSVEVPVRVTRDGDRIAVEGQFRIRQTDFGIEPFSAAAGALRVGDALGIHFRLVGEHSADPFPTTGE